MGKQLLEFGKKLTVNKSLGHKIAQAGYLHSVGDENLNEIKMARILSDLLRESEIDGCHGIKFITRCLSGGPLAA